MCACLIALNVFHCFQCEIIFDISQCSLVKFVNYLMINYRQLIIYITALWLDYQRYIMHLSSYLENIWNQCKENIYVKLTVHWDREMWWRCLHYQTFHLFLSLFEQTLQLSAETLWTKQNRFNIFPATFCSHLSLFSLLFLTARKNVRYPRTAASITIARLITIITLSSRPENTVK